MPGLQYYAHKLVFLNSRSLALFRQSVEAAKARGTKQCRDLGRLEWKPNWEIETVHVYLLAAAANQVAGTWVFFVCTYGGLSLFSHWLR